MAWHERDKKQNQPQHDKTNKRTCAPSEDSDQPGHPPSLIRVFAVRMKKPWVLRNPLSAEQRLIRLRGCPGWSESSLGAHATLLVFSCYGSDPEKILNLMLFWSLFLGTCSLVVLLFVYLLNNIYTAFLICVSRIETFIIFYQEKWHQYFDL